MPLDREQLEARLKNWADEYGGGRYENIGWQGRNLLQTLIEHRGFVPSGRGYVRIPIQSAADEVETIVRQIEAGESFKAGRVLRCDYFIPNAPMAIRLKALRSVGVSVGRTGYYDLLAEAKRHVAAALSDPSREAA